MYIFHIRRVYVSLLKHMIYGNQQSIYIYIYILCACIKCSYEILMIYFQKYRNI